MAAKSGARRRRAKRGHERIGLALAGGGPAGAVYEIGALRALEEAVEGLDLNDLACYVGVSAGSFLASCLANQLTVSQMARALMSHQHGVHPLHFDTFFTPAYREWASRARTLPRRARAAIAELAAGRDSRSAAGALLRLAQALPVAIFDNEPIREYLATLFAGEGRTDDFRELRRTLIVVAADLSSGRAVKFGTRSADHVPISRAVQASTAVPGIYPPVLIDGRHCVDGVLLKTLHASVLLERGVELALCVNPIVPVDTARAVAGGALPEGALVECGLPTILSQTFRTLIHSRMEVGIAAYEHRYPNADVVLFEPGRDEYQMFFSNMFSFSARRRICELAYRATRRTLLHRADELAPVFERHGLRLRLDVLHDGSRGFWKGLGGATPRMDTTVSEGLARALDRLAETAAV